MKRVRRAFVTGLLVLVPLLATADILRWLIRQIDTISRKYLPTELLNFDFPGLGIVLALVIIILVGVLTQNFMGTWVVHQIDSVLKRFPFVGGLYGGIKKFLETVLNPTSDKFSEAVLVEFPKEGIQSIGFLTGKPDAKITRGQKKRLINVFIPLVPNPTAGFYFLVPEDSVTKLDLTVQQAFKIVISMGVVSSEEKFEWKPAVVAKSKSMRKRKKK